MDERRRACLDAMGIVRWVRRGLSPAEGVVAENPPPVSAAPPPPPEEPADSAASLDWVALRRAVEECRACGLCECRNRTVFGSGDEHASLMIIGEAPGAEEDRQGVPFVGRAGELLTNMLRAIGLGREQAYIANILKCRPPGNRNPTVEEAAACAPWLRRQIELVAPKVILAAGGVAAHNLLARDESVGRLRHTLHRLPDGEIPVLVTYHPAYLLRRPEEKAKAWVDLQKLHGLLHG